MAFGFAHQPNYEKGPRDNPQAFSLVVTNRPALNGGLFRLGFGFEREHRYPVANRSQRLQGYVKFIFHVCFLVRGGVIHVRWAIGKGIFAVSLSGYIVRKISLIFAAYLSCE